MKLLLYDIDGTLLYTHGLGRRVVAGVLSDLLGRPVEAHGADFSGKTDPQIFRELLEREHGARGDVGDLAAAVREAIAIYEGRMDAALRQARVTALPGAAEALAATAAHEGALVGLLTGNLQPLAYGKLRAAGLDVAHVVEGLGGFGSDHEDRDCLGPVALARAEAHAGRPFSGADTIIIGDTPRDIACARAIGATAVAVTTGNFCAEALAGADYILPSLEPLDALLDLLGA